MFSPKPTNNPLIKEYTLYEIEMLERYGYDEIIGIKKYLTEIESFLMGYINHHRRVLITANPASGKTYFFTQLAMRLKKRKKRIVFVTPFLLIQEQFKKELDYGSSGIDFTLNHKSNRKKLVETDFIITTTFKSLHKIYDQLNSEDYIIVDEAHELFKTFSNKKKIEYYNKTVYALKKTKSKLVLMSGTPYNGLIRLLNLKNIKIYKSEKKAVINLKYTSASSFQIVTSFAKECINIYGNKSLNVIFIQDIRTIYSLSEELSKSFKCGILSGELKDSKIYKKLIEDSLIDSSIQFLLTTSVLGTGTNILNENIGKVLILNNCNPVEIKQFSKRFRRKLDVEIDVVNHFRRTFSGLEPLKRGLLKTKRERQRNYLTESISFFETQELNGFTSFFPSERTIPLEIGTPQDMQKQLLERFLVQECFFVDRINRTLNNPLCLSKELAANGDDLLIRFDYEVFSKVNNEEKYKFESNQVDKALKELIINIIEDKDRYLATIHQYLKLHDHFQFKNLIDLNFKFEAPETKLDEQKFPNILVRKFIIPPIIEYGKYFSNFENTLKFLLLPKNKRKRFLCAIEISRIRELYYDIIPVEEGFLLKLKKGYDRKSSENRQLNILLDLIKVSFNYLIKLDSVITLEFKSILLTSLKTKDVSQSNPFTLFPLDEVTKKDGLINITNSLAWGLILGMFLIEKKQKKVWNRAKNKRLGSYIFKNDNESCTSSVKYKGKYLSKDTMIEDFMFD